MECLPVVSNRVKILSHIIFTLIILVRNLNNKENATISVSFVWFIEMLRSTVEPQIRLVMVAFFIFHDFFTPGAPKALKTF